MRPLLLLSACLVMVASACGSSGDGGGARATQLVPLPTTLTCAVVGGVMTCQASGLVPGAYTALNVDMTDCGGLDYGPNGISEAIVDALGNATYIVDLAHLQRFQDGPPPTECLGPREVMVAYQDGITVVSTVVDWELKVAGPSLSCSVTNAVLVCVATGLQPNIYAALNTDMTNCNGLAYGINGIGDATVDANGYARYEVDLNHMPRFQDGPPPVECLGSREVMVAYQNGITVVSTMVDLSL